ncbi:MAG: polysaccharide deacetylase family protein [Actinomycetota bacterium]
MSARFAAAAVAKKAVKLALLGPATARRTAEPGLTVLIYHRVGAGMGREMDMPVRTFRGQMEWLSANAAVVGLREGLERLEGGLRRDLVAITFDDGYRDVYRRAWPVLRDLQLPAALFLATGFLEGELPAPIRPGAAGPGHVVEPLGWDEVGEMAATGLVELGSHSHTHREFDRLSVAEAEEECDRSNEVLRRRAGVEAEMFAYPRAVVGNETVVARRYRWALAAGGARNVPGRVLRHTLARTPVRASDGLFFFRRRLAGIAPLEDRLYDRLRRSP